MNELMTILLAGGRVTDVLSANFPGDRRLMVKFQICDRRGYVIA